MTTIPLFDLNYGVEEEKAVLETLRSKWISIGPKNQELEEKFSSLLGVRYAVALSNCTAALHLALKILDIGDNDEVIVPSLTFVATVNAVRYVNAIPVFADIRSSQDLTIAPKLIEQAISDRTKAIIVMHYAGFPCAMDHVMNIAAKHNLKVVEDACHGPLSEYKGQKLGTIGDIGCFSFFSNKNISTGEGGVLVTSDEDYQARVKLLRSHGMTSLSYDRSKGHSTLYDVVALGYNYRLDDIRAALGIVQLERLKGDLKQRSKVRHWYIDRLSGMDELTIPFVNHAEFVSNYIFPVVLNNSDYRRRDAIRLSLQNKGIQTSVHYPAVHRFSIYSDCAADLPNTDYVTDNLISLPMFSNLKKDDVNYICSELKKECREPT
ncbi:Aminotransferase, DegT/DnrJ/EryC1/StrS family [Olavius sp. associated proteobacterium Delta 1]|nr:Aminotransferase, DegT/DnrJ/EryC1/StrS family [Olavius sp. associated proteobacterium Delta 1]